jgi:hypothetical protein
LKELQPAVSGRCCDEHQPSLHQGVERLFTLVRLEEAGVSRDPSFGEFGPELLGGDADQFGRLPSP